MTKTDAAPPDARADLASTGLTREPVHDADLSRFAMPLCITLMFAIAAVFYLHAAQDDVDRYPSCFIKNCSAS